MASKTSANSRQRTSASATESFEAEKNAKTTITLICNSRIMLSEDDYHSLYSEPNSWANVLQLSLLTSKSAY